VTRPGGARARDALFTRRALSALGLSVCVLCVAPARAQSLERIFSTANEAYFHGDFAKAAAQYQRLLDAGVEDPDVCFNLATAHARLGHLGQAVVYFERTLWLRPGDETAEQELATARAMLGRRRAERDGQATVRARPPLSEALVRPIGADLLALLVLALDALFFALLLARAREKREALRLGLAISLPLVGLLLLVSAAGLLVKTEVGKTGPAAIVLREGAELREGPDPHAQVRALGHEGQVARASRHEGSFVRVQLEGGDRGWMKNNDLGTIAPD
jgi:tetratricopeptide (TPR) repeat protein